MKLVIPIIIAATCHLALAKAESNYVLENTKLKRSLHAENGISTQLILNKLDGKTLIPTESHSFVIHLANGKSLSSSDFTIDKSDRKESNEITTLTFDLSSENPSLHVTLQYSLGKNDAFTRKKLAIKPRKDLEVKQIDLESFHLTEAYQPYAASQITTVGPAQWRPGLGQPLYTKSTGTFWGVEFPAAVNTVKDGKLACSYLVGKTLVAGENYTTHSSVLGVSDSPDFIKEAFFDYIDLTRIRPLRLQTQYNSWFNSGVTVNAESFTKTIAHIHENLHTERGVPPLKAYVIDDGWQNTKDDWSKKAWTVNGKFNKDFSKSLSATKSAQSSLGIWLSPGCVFGGQPAIPQLKAGGCRALDPWMSMTDPKYMQNLEERMVELTRQGITYFKLDGIFGHLNKRNFDIPGFKGGEIELNNPKYDQQKIQYLSDGAERLMKIFGAMQEVNPDVYIVISNGAWLSPFWLQHVDAVWMINAGDAAGGSNRTQELVYRDHKYYELALTDNTQFPLNSIFNHEPKKVTTQESKKTFRRYLYMNMSRGTGFVELYIKPFVLKNYDWDVLAEGLLWVHDAFPTFKRARMHGGNPKLGDAYGYTAWLPERGYISLHNPSDQPKKYSIKLDRSFGLHPSSTNTTYLLSSPLADCTDGLKAKYSYGDTLSLVLEPKEIRILNFDTTKRDWSKLLDLQSRTDEELPVTPKL